MTASWTLVRVVLAILLALWFVLHLRPLDRYVGFELPLFGRIPGLLMLALGGGLVLWCGGILARVGIFESPGNRMFPREFVVTGPFRIIRNPMSFGATALFAGLGLWLRSISISDLQSHLNVFGHPVFDLSFRGGAHRGTWPGKAVWQQLCGLQTEGWKMVSETQNLEDRIKLADF